MKKKLTSFVVAGLLISTTVYAQEQLALGSKAPMLDHGMEDVSGRNLSLNDVAKDNGLLVVFSCNTCPWVMKWEDRYSDMSQMTDENDIGMIAINPNEAYRDRGDGMEDMIKYAEKSDYDFPYVLDKNHQVADAFGATRTPHIYLFNNNMELVYVGAIDDNANDANAVEQYYLKDAIEAMIMGTEIAQPSTRSLGCTIKRVS